MLGTRYTVPVFFRADKQSALLPTAWHFRRNILSWTDLFEAVKIAARDTLPDEGEAPRKGATTVICGSEKK